MRRPYLQLLLKEAKQALGTALVFTGIIAALLLYLLSRVGSWPNEIIMVIMVSLSGFIPFWALWRTYYSLRQEWNGDHMYLLLSLPIPGWYITSTKLIVALLELLVYTALIQGALLYVFSVGGDTILPLQLLTEPAFIGTALRVAVLSVLMLLVGMIVLQFSYLAARLVSKRRGLMMLFVVFVSGWLVLRVGGLISPLLQWIPDVPLHQIEIRDGLVQTSTARIGLAPFFGSLLASLALFWFGSNLLERDIEL